MVTTFDVREILGDLIVTAKTSDKDAQLKVDRFHNKLRQLNELVGNLTGLHLGQEEWEEFDFSNLEQEVELKGHSLTLFKEVTVLLDDLKSDQRIQITRKG